jgi:DNA-binding response OmpR family regulator
MFMLHGKKPTVLLIEADPSLRRLIALGLQHQNMDVVEASSLTHARSIETADLLIIDVDSGIHSDWSLLTSIQTISTFAAVPTIVLAWEQLPILRSSSVATQTRVAYLTKPFDARVMQESINQLLAVRAEQEAAILAQAEEVLLATYKTQTPPSIWPVITAIGLLIAFTGMLLQVAVTILGILIVIIALLLWTLGTKPSHRTVALG